MNSKINLETLDDEEITVISNWLVEHDRKIHKDFLDRFAMNSFNEHSNEAMQVHEAIQEIEMSIMYYRVLEPNKEFIKDWIFYANGINFHFYLSRELRNEKIERLANVLDKRLKVKASSIDKKNKI
jgi:hypothetical protein